MPEADSIFHARSDGISAEGIPDQYADGTDNFSRICESFKS